MTPEGRGRRCDACERVVVDLRGLTRRQAEARYAAIVRAEGRACGRAEGDPVTGALVFAPETRAPSRTLVRGALVAAALAAGCGSSRSQVASAEPAARLIPLESKPEGPTHAAGPADAGTPGAPDSGTAPDASTQAVAPTHRRHPRHGHGGTTPPSPPPYEMMGDMAMK